MKSLVIYYSLDGNCKLIAEELQKRIGADILRLKPKKEISSKGFGKYFWGGRQVIMKDIPELEEYSIDFNLYDHIIIGTPVWAWTYTPAIGSFLASNKLSVKKVSIYCCHQGSKGKTLINLKDKLVGNDIVSEIDFFEPITYDKNKLEEKLSSWIESIK